MCRRAFGELPELIGELCARCGPSVFGLQETRSWGEQVPEELGGWTLVHTRDNPSAILMPADVAAAMIRGSLNRSLLGRPSALRSLAARSMEACVMALSILSWLRQD